MTLSHTSHNIIITLHKSLFIMKIEKQQKWHSIGNKDIHTTQKGINQYKRETMTYVQLATKQSIVSGHIVSVSLSLKIALNHMHPLLTKHKQLW